jgi:hypothetical protein
MATEPVEINPELLERARRLAEQSHRSIDDILQEALDRMERPSKPQGSIVGLFADEPELVDQILDDVYRTREQGQLRLPDHGGKSPEKTAKNRGEKLAEKWMAEK